MIVIKVNYTTDQPIIKVNYDDSPIYISTTVDATYIKVDYGTGGGSGGAIWGDIIGNLSDQLDLQAALDAKVPYTGATANVDLGEYELKAGQIELDQSPTGTAGVAVTRWNDAIGSTETTLKGGNVVLKNGVDLVARVVNKVNPNTTLTKAAYQAVKVSGAQGQRLAIALAQANNDNNSADTLGLVIETIPTNQEGFIMTVGSLEGINTTGSLQGETWSDGDVLYLSPTTAGAITNIKPNGSTGHIVVIGYVEYAHANNGKIYVKIMNGWELDELHNVFISSPANNDALIYESATSLWKNKSIDTALGYTPVPSTRSLTINGTAYDLSADRTWSVGTVTSVALTVPTGLVVTSGSPITTSGTIAVGLQSGYSIPTTVKQGNWDDAYTFVSAFPSQTGNSGKYLTTDGSTLSWGTVSTANIYNSDGTLTGNRTISLSTFSLSFDKDISIGGIKFGKGTTTSSLLNIAIGNGALASATVHGTYYNVAIGTQSMQYTTGAGNTVAIGNFSLYSNVNGGANTVAIGHESLYSIDGVGSRDNVAIGYRAGNNITSGRYNVIIGDRAASTISGGVTSATNLNNSIIIGSQAYPLANSQTNQIVIGYGSVGLGSNTTVIGNSSITDTAIYGRTLINYSSPSPSTYALDVNGTGRFTQRLNIDSSINFPTAPINIEIGGTTRVSIQNNITAIGATSNATINIYSGSFSIGSNKVSSGTYKWYLGGTQSGNGLTTGDNIVAFGHEALFGVTTGSNHIALGTYAGAGTTRGNTGNHSNGIFLGNATGASTNTTALSNITIIGHEVRTDLSNVFMLGRSDQTIMVGQGTSVGSGAIFQIDSTTKGFLPPRMTETQKNAISTPATGLIVYQTDGTEGLYERTSSAWRLINSSLSGSGTASYIPKWTGTSSLGNSLIYDTGTSILINTTTSNQGALQVAQNGGGVLVTTNNTNFGFGIVNSSSGNKTWDISPFNNTLAFNESGVGSNIVLHQGGNVSIGTANNVASAALSIESTTKGFLPPKMTSSERTAISSPATGLIVYQTDGTEGLYENTSTGWRILYNTPSGGSGITRSVNNISTTTTAGAAASTDYVYLISGTTTLTLPTAAGNTNRYTLKNVGTGTVTINTTSSQTIDGSTSITMAVQYTALDVISDGTNWNII